MNKIGQFALDGHDRIPRFKPVAVKHGTDFQVFRMIGAGFQNRDGVVDTAYYRVLTLEHLHHDMRVVVVLFQDVL